jgi:hypothetical protein
VPAKHPLRLVREVVNDVLAAFSMEIFPRLTRMVAVFRYHLSGCWGAAAAAFYAIRSERQFIEQLDYNLLCRWFAGLGVDEPVWEPTVFTKNRNRLLEAA